MGKRKSRKAFNWKLFILILCFPVAGIYFLGNHFGWVQLLVGIGTLCVLIFILKHIVKLRKHANLMERYADEELVHDIEQGYFWQGQTAEQLRDALGEPEDIDEQVLKTKIKSVWKYNHLGGNRYGLRVMLDNAVVTGWDQKD